MAQYSTGTVSTVAGTTEVTGVDTLWLTYAAQGDIISIGGDSVYYTIASVDSDTVLQLTANYPSTVGAQDYVLVTDFTANHSIPLANQGDLQFADLYSRAMKIIDAALGLGLVYKGEVIDKDLDAAPGAPSDGDKYIVAATPATGDLWFGFTDYLATWNDGDSVWDFELPDGGNFVWVLDEDALYFYTGSGWQEWTTLIGGANVYQTTFVDGDLTLGVLTVTHNLGNKYPMPPVVFTSADVPWVVGWTVVDLNTLTIDLNAFGTWSGTGRVTVTG